MQNQSRDLLERVFWTVASGGLAVVTAALGEVVAEVDQIVTAVPLMAVWNSVLVWARRHLDVLPSPGEGLPGFEVNPWDDLIEEHTDR